VTIILLIYNYLHSWQPVCFEQPATPPRRKVIGGGLCHSRMFIF